MNFVEWICCYLLLDFMLAVREGLPEDSLSLLDFAGAKIELVQPGDSRYSLIRSFVKGYQPSESQEGQRYLFHVFGAGYELGVDCFCFVDLGGYREEITHSFLPSTNVQYRRHVEDDLLDDLLENCLYFSHSYFEKDARKADLGLALEWDDLEREEENPEYLAYEQQYDLDFLPF